MLLRPAAAPTFTANPGALRNTEVPFAAPDLQAAVLAERAADADADAYAYAGRRARAASAVVGRLEAHMPVPAADGELTSRFCDLVMGEAAPTRVDQGAERLRVSVRSLQRVARSHVGPPRLAMIRRYRLQESAVRLRA